ncbi:hypothetical protein G647_03424 [Cladophialophora carrionii CBS 160.54]|uniref:Uncharacterized protein n=1 Tax=Cladophialophora carrionii CBS 160.54 TaxID=1279043 RepID=V9DB32_9EURO|nr:uncharacterized protein G647_03424 [Cladophialophora carrionii CBS 160.54]ETI24055.1 hypothetical protein G647_03424 [Cladophialophora carrionii CBS 160.54]
MQSVPLSKVCDAVGSTHSMIVRGHSQAMMWT